MMNTLTFSDNRFISYETYLKAFAGERLAFRESLPKYRPYHDSGVLIRLLPSSLLGAWVLGTCVRVVSRYRGGILVEVDEGTRARHNKMIQSIRKAHAH
jgi:hypothetical protein